MYTEHERSKTTAVTRQNTLTELFVKESYKNQSRLTFPKLQEHF